MDLGKYLNLINFKYFISLFIVYRNTGCYIKLLENDGFHSNLSQCENVHELHKMQDELLKIKTSSYNDLKYGYGCYLPCSKKNLKIVKVVEEPIIWHTEWISEV